MPKKHASKKFREVTKLAVVTREVAVHVTDPDVKTDWAVNRKL